MRGAKGRKAENYVEVRTMSTPSKRRAAAEELLKNPFISHIRQKNWGVIVGEPIFPDQGIRRPRIIRVA
jgi:hypothetical protein